MDAPRAALDVGTNTCLLLIAARARADDLGQPGGLRVIEDHCQAARLGEGLARTGRIAPEAFERGLAVLDTFAARLRAHALPAAHVRAVGTAVLRRAANAAEFIAAARARCGLVLEIASEEEEARLACLAARAQGAAADVLVLDVGGGSTELAAEAGRVRLSAPVGALTLSEAFLGPAPSEPGGFPALLAHARAALELFPPGLARGRALVGLGGTCVNLAALELGLERFDAPRTEGAEVEAGAALRWALRLAELGLDERRRLPIEPGRAAILPAGLACLAAALERTGARSFRASGRGLRYGVLWSLLEAEGAAP